MSFVKRKGVLYQRGLKFTLTLFKDAVWFSSLGSQGHYFGFCCFWLEKVLQPVEVLT